MSQSNSPLSPGAVVFFESYLHVVTDVALVLKVSHFVLLCMSCAALISVSEQQITAFYEQMICVISIISMFVPPNLRLLSAKGYNEQFIASESVKGKSLHLSPFGSNQQHLQIIDF